MAASGPISPVVPATGALRPLGIGAVTLTDGFWAERQRLNADTFIDHADRWITSMGWLDAFAVAAGGTRTIPMQGKLFTDADVYKLLEGMVWDEARHPDPRREERIAEITRLVAGAQEDDGYLNTYFGPLGRDQRYTDLSHGHELYCAGHLIQAAVARIRAGIEDDLTRTARRLADRICDDFGPDGRDGASDGHPVIEVAMVELYRATGERRYLEQAGRFLEGRGRNQFHRHEIGPEYYLDDQPIREARVLRGHVVRAMYLTAGAVDYAVETGDADLLGVLEEQWANTWRARTYLTGGMGARHLGESFGDDYELPPDRAYAETCGAVGSIMVAWRLLLATGDATYADAIERLLYNMIATHLSPEGDRIFYVNRLQQRQPAPAVPDGVAPFRKDTARANWFWVACCPTNVARLLASMSDLVAATDDEGLVVHQLASADIAVTSPAGVDFRVELRTDYPWDGRVTLRVAEGSGQLRLRVRVPAWCESATLTVAGDTEQVGPGYAEVTRDWRPGDTVTLDIPLAPRTTRPDPRIDAVRGTLAVERGPLVYCAESLEPGQPLDAVTVTDQEPREVPLDGPGDARIGVVVDAATRPVPEAGPWPYGTPAASGEPEPAELTLVPYYAWSNRGPSTMRVWLPTS